MLKSKAFPIEKVYVPAKRRQISRSREGQSHKDETPPILADHDRGLLAELQNALGYCGRLAPPGSVSLARRRDRPRVSRAGTPALNHPPFGHSAGVARFPGARLAAGPRLGAPRACWVRTP